MNIYHQLLHVDWRLKDNRKAIKTARNDTEMQRIYRLIKKDEMIQRDLIAQINNKTTEAKQ